MYYHCKELGVPISFGLGASFDFEAGNIKRAPRWMADHGLEWLYRIIQDPKRLAKRYLVDDMKILRMAVKYKPPKIQGGGQSSVVHLAFYSFRAEGLYAV